jgi:heavy metal translocating P-type ATPase
MKRILRKAAEICRQVPMLPTTIVAAAFVALLWRVRFWPGSPSWFINPSVGQVIVVALVLISVVDAVRGMVESLREGHVGVDILAVLAMLSTLAVGAYWASWAVVLMVWSGEAIESFAQGKAAGNLNALVEAAPRTAHISTVAGIAKDLGLQAGFEDGHRETAGFRPTTSGPSAHAVERAASHFRTVPAENVALGDVLVVLPGETVPVDGTLLGGSATLDLSAINGEPLPRTVFAGAHIMSGAVNGSGALVMRATRLAKDSQYQTTMDLVTAARTSRAPVVKTADALAVPFTAISLVIAIVAWVASGTAMRFAQVLVLATPCPLLIAAPVAYVAGTARLAKSGVFIKSQEVLESLGRVGHIFFDKTGTLTVSRPQVVRVEVRDDVRDALIGKIRTAADLEGYTSIARRPKAEFTAGMIEDYVIAMAAVVETYSVHILAHGIVEAGRAVSRRLGGGSEPGGGDVRTVPNCAARPGRSPAADAKPLVDPMSKHRRSEGFPFGTHPVVRDVHEEVGRGVEGTVDGGFVRVGRFEYVAAPFEDAKTPEEFGVSASSDKPDGSSPDDLFPASRFGQRSADEMVSYVSVDGQVVARIVLRDVPRPNARESLHRIQQLGVRRVTMLTGDGRASADVIAREVGITDVRAGMLPQDKLTAVESVASEPTDQASGLAAKALCLLRRLSGQAAPRPVSMMVGDGVNDAPVLAAADIGVAVTDGTSTAASQSAQLVIMDDDIGDVPQSIVIARQTKRVLLQSVVAGLGLAIVCMVLAAFGLIPVVVGAFMQEGIDVVSILWALTALRDRQG